ncbi:shikimate dehydrogenase family protein [Thermovenabulum sp.]|uniref:shikimate dehydrogenase family protein n=1 Tax=Thermovenabulum sp. TaxID=3100335 RepID=UPI003C7A0592
MGKFDIKNLPELAVIGWPLLKTFSPPMQNAALKELNIPWRYEAIPVPQEELKEFFHLASQKMVGFNVTMPHKGDVYLMCDEVDDFAQKSSSVNTVVFERKDGKTVIKGYNTDAPGLLKSLSERAKGEFKKDIAVIFGAGGAAAGCAAALASWKMKKIAVVNRNVEKAKKMVDDLKTKFDGIEFSALYVKDKKEVFDIVKESNIVVSCIPEEGAALYQEFLEGNENKEKIFCDLSYGERPGRLFKRAAEKGFIGVSGIEVLLWQGVFAFEIFTGEKAPADVMRKVLESIAGSWWF